MTALAEPAEDNGFHANHVALLLDSLHRLTGRRLLPPGTSAVATARTLYHAPFVVLSHDTAADPRFTYANRQAQTLFAMPWQEIVGLPSRYSAEPLAREERQRLLDRVARQGYIDDYSGVRIARDGRRFRVANAIVWNLADADGQPCGQAASFDTWHPVG